MTVIDRERVERLSGRELGQLNDALRGAFHNRAVLRQFLAYELDKSLDAYASDAVGMRDVVEVVLDNAKAEGWLAELVQAALDTSQNPGLHEWARPYALSPAATVRAGESGGVGGPSTAAGSRAARSVLGEDAGADSAGKPTLKELVTELANIFYNPIGAHQLLLTVGLSAGRQPLWQAGNAETFWHEVARALDNGAVRDGWPRLLEAALDGYPNNPVFLGCAGTRPAS